MPRLKHFYGQNHVHYLTSNIYRKARIFDSDRYKCKFVETLDDLRTELGFKIVGYVLIRRLTDDRIRRGADDSRRGEAALRQAQGGEQSRTAPRPYYFSSGDGPAALR